MLNYLCFFRERGWTPIDAAAYATAWRRFGGSVMTHPQIVERLSDLAGIPVRYLGWFAGGEILAALPAWGRYLALSKEALARSGKKKLFDLGNAEIILPVAKNARISLRHRARYLSEVSGDRISGARRQDETLAMSRPPDELSGKFRYNQRRELRLLEKAGGVFCPVTDLTPEDRALIYADLFQRRWGIEAPGKKHLSEVFGLLREFMCGSLITLGGKPVAIQILYRVESPEWISIEYINGGVAPEARDLSPGSVLSFVNTQEAWAEARALGKNLRYSFGRADREYKDRWSRHAPVYQV
ncbi:MAG: antimicrobial resistance protein Mig-14 [Candidatus Accumulibacter sp.]|nr:antimicrobial resistance protein Mig-14 [Accumulibacter sp.]